MNAGPKLKRLSSESLKTWTWTPSWTPEAVGPTQHKEPHLDQIRGGLTASDRKSVV